MNKNEIKPTPGNVLIKPYEKPKEVNGFILSDGQANDAPVRGVVLEVSYGSPFKVGQELFFRRYAIDELKYLDENSKEEKVWLVDEREVLAVLGGESQSLWERIQNKLKRYAS